MDYISLRETIKRNEIDMSGTEKEKYTKYRVPIVTDFIGLFEKRLQQGTKERCIIIIIGEFECAQSRMCLQELSIDLSNLVYWKTGHLPGVIRFATSHGEWTSSSQIESFKSLLDPIRMQYFSTPRFEVEASKRPSSDSSTPVEVTKTSTAPNYKGVCVNPYDILVYANTAALETFLHEVLKLHQMETSFASQHVSTEYGSGGSLYLVEGKLVSSVSGWRRVDWLVLAQVPFLPRYWCLDSTQSLNEFIALFNYRHWVSRFDGLEEHDMSNLQIVSYPDSDLKRIKKALKNSSKFNMNRRKRESDWKGIEELIEPSDVGFKRDEQKLSNAAAFARNFSLRPDSSIWNPYEVETTEYRISSGHMEALKELIVFYNREQRFSEALKALRSFNTSSATNARARGRSTKVKMAQDGQRNQQLSAEFNKLEGIALLGIGDAGSATRKLTLYRDYLESVEEDSRLLGRALDAANSARLWAEVASVYSACSNFSAAQSAASKALTLEPTQPTALRTLVMAAGRSGKSSLSEEEWIFGFFATSKSLQLDDAHEYYEKRVKKFPNNGFFWYGFGMFNFVMARNLPACAPLFERAIEILPNEARIAESYATYLFQTRSPRLRFIKELYDKSLALEPSNLLYRANSAAFFLFLRSAQLNFLSSMSDSSPQQLNSSTSLSGKKDVPISANRGSGEEYVYSLEEFEDVERREVLEGFDYAQSLLESVLFSVSLIDAHPQVYLECWFYVLCYTMQRDRQIQALQYLKAALRKGLRARHWDMSMHIHFLRKHALLPANDLSWAHTLVRVIGDREPLDALDPWSLWNGLKSDKLVSNFKLAENSFRVCVSPSKRREKKEELSPPALSKAKSAPLHSSTIASANIFADEFSVMTSPTTLKKTSTPKDRKVPARSTAKRTATSKSSTYSPSVETSKSDLKTPSNPSSTRRRTPEPVADDDELLDLLETSSVTSAASSSATSRNSPTHSVDSLSALDTSFGFEENVSLRRSTSGAGSFLLSTTSVSVPSRLARSRTQPLPQMLNSAGSKTTRASSRTKSSASSASFTSKASSSSLSRTPSQIQEMSGASDQVVDMSLDPSMFDFAPELLSPSFPNPGTPTMDDDFSEIVPKRPTRAAASAPKAVKRLRRT